MTIKDLPDTKNIRELLAITRPEVGWPMVAMDALVDITTICDLIEGGGLIRPDLAPQAGSVDVEAVIDAVTSFYTRKEDRNFAAQVARNTLDNLLSGAPVGGDRPAIPGLQEAIAVLREEISVMENIITRNLEGNNKNTRRKLEQWKALYEAAGQSGVPEGWQPIESAPRDGSEIRARRIFKGGGETHNRTYWKNGWIYKMFGKYEYCWEPTHWMPLPAAPRDGRD